MALYPCPECEAPISERADACPHCGAAWAGVCPECHEFRVQDSEACKNCGYPFSKLSNVTKGAQALGRNAKEKVDFARLGVGTLWFKFWVYIRAPIGALLYVAFAVAFPDYLLLGLGAAVFIIGVAYGLHHRQYSAWQANWILVFEPLVTIGFLPIIAGASGAERFTGFVWAAILFVVWALPNWFYFKKREAWFTKEDTTLHELQDNELEGTETVSNESDENELEDKQAEAERLRQQKSAADLRRLDERRNEQLLAIQQKAREKKLWRFLVFLFAFLMAGFVWYQYQRSLQDEQANSLPPIRLENPTGDSTSALPKIRLIDQIGNPREANAECDPNDDECYDPD